MLTYLSRKRKSTLTSKLEEQMKAQQPYWQNVKERIRAVICTLAEQGLSSRGDKEQFGSSNNGNYLGLLKLVAKFDSFLLAHTNRYENYGSGNLSYWLKTICKELLYFYKLCNFGMFLSSSVNLVTTCLPPKGGGFPSSAFSKNTTSEMTSCFTTLSFLC